MTRPEMLGSVLTKHTNTQTQQANGNLGAKESLPHLRATPKTEAEGTEPRVGESTTRKRSVRITSSISAAARATFHVREGSIVESGTTATRQPPRAKSYGSTTGTQQRTDGSISSLKGEDKVAFRG